MATARDNPYEGGSGAGGKFRKRPFRRATQSTPYDRPPTAFRNQVGSTAGATSGNKGWLSKLVDPAQRLITASAHSFFFPFFRKRLTTSSSPSSQAPERNQQVRDKNLEAVSSVNLRGEEANTGGNIMNSNSESGGFKELEQIVKQMTLTRSEVDQLKALLCSRTTDSPGGSEEKISESIPASSLVPHESKEKLEKAPLPMQENGVEGHFTTTAAVSRSVLDKDVASPAELAKAYMGSKISKVSPSVLGFCSQTARDDADFLGNQHLAQSSPIMSLVPQSTGHVGVPDNSFMNLRSRGRSALYSMARSPYARVHSASTFKSAGLTVDSDAGPSSPLLKQEQNQLTTSKQGSLKRRSSVLENDIGSVGPIRRIRQKPNLLYSRSLSQLVSRDSFPSRAISSDTIPDPSSSVRKSLLSSESNCNVSEESTGDRGNSFTGSTGIFAVPSKSSEMASKILQTINIMASPKEKSSPTKLTTSMLSGKALKSMEDANSSQLLANARDVKRLEGPSTTLLFAVENMRTKKLDISEENRLKKSVGAFDGVAHSQSSLDNSVSAKEFAHGVKTSDTAMTSFIPQSLQKKQTFRMSAHEDFLELDDNSYPNGVAVPSAAGVKERMITEADNKRIPTEAISVQNASGAIKIKSPASSNMGIPDGSMAAGKGTDPVASSSQLKLASDNGAPEKVSNSAAPIVSFGDKVASSNETNVVSSAPLFSFGHKVSNPKESNASPVSGFGDNAAPSKAANSSFPTFTFYTKNGDKAPQLTFSSSSSVMEIFPPKTDGLPISMPESSSSLATDVATESVAKASGLDEADNKGSMISGLFSTTETIPASTASTLTSTSSASTASTLTSTSSASTSTSYASIFSFVTPANGSLASATPLSSPSLVPKNVTSGGASSSSSVSTSLSFDAKNITSGNCAPSYITSSLPGSGVSLSPSASVFKFGLSAAESTTTSAVSSTTSADSEAKTKEGASSDSLPGSPFGSIPAVANTGSSILGFSASASSSKPDKPSNVSLPFSSGSGTITSPSDAQATPGIGDVASTQSMPIQFSHSASSTSFGLNGNTTTLFGSSEPAKKLFNVGSTFGQTSASSEAISITSTDAASDTTNATGQPVKSPVFGSALNPTGFALGASSSSAVGASSSAPTFSSGFSFGASSASVSSSTTAPIFNSTGFVFGASSAPVAATSSVPTFSPTGFSFGASAASTGASSGAPTSSSTGFAFGASSTSGAANSAPASNSTGFTFGPCSASVGGSSSAATSASFTFGVSPVAASSAAPISNSTGFAFGASSSSVGASNMAPTFNSTGFAFGASSAPSSSSSSVFSFTSAPSTSSQPSLGTLNSGFAFGSASPSNNDQMSMEDSMAEDTVQASAPAPVASVFGQQSIAPQPSGHVFGSSVLSGPSPFQFGTQQNPPIPQNPSPFQASGSLDFNGGGSFSLGSGGGGDKSKRKIIRVKNRRK